MVWPWLLQPGMGALLAESDTFETVEGNIYFPPATINREHFVENSHHTVCGWKGEASYYDLQVKGETNANAAFYYPDPLPAAMKIQGLRGVLERRRGERVTAVIAGHGADG